MRTANTHKNMARCAATATLACVLGLGLAAPAYADTASDLAAARTKLEQIGTQTQQIYDELATQTQALDQTAGEITQKQQEIADGQAKLSTYVAGEYKTGDDWTTLAPGMVLTVEPGLYLRPSPQVPEHLQGIGIRIEDDVLVTETGREVYTAVPKTVAEIEDLMRHD